jgi:hypothetical protein
MKHGKVTDVNVDICHSTSLPTLTNNLLRGLVKSDILDTCQDMVSDLILAISELSKLFFTKTSGIDPIFSKNIVPTLAALLRMPQLKVIHMAAIKSLGYFISQSCIVPTRMHSFFRELIEYNIIGSLVSNIQNVGSKVTPTHLATAQVLAMLVNPAFGNTFSFPWKRGPHD